MSRNVRKRTFGHVRQANIQIRLFAQSDMLFCCLFVCFVVVVVVVVFLFFFFCFFFCFFCIGLILDS